MKTKDLDSNEQLILTLHTFNMKFMALKAELVA